MAVRVLASYSTWENNRRS